MKSFLQATLTDRETKAYLEFLSSIAPEIMEEAVERVLLQFRPERTRLPLPAEFLEFCPALGRSERNRLTSNVKRWRLEFEMENGDGSVDRAREEFRRQLKEVTAR